MSENGGRARAKDRARIPLTDATLRNAAFTGTPDKFSDWTAQGHATGLYVLVNASGKYWRYDYRFGGKRKTIAYGVYPALTLAAARKAHWAAKELLATGNDPMAERKAQKQAQSLTFGVVAERWYAHWKQDRTAKHATEVWRRLESDVLPALGAVPVGDLTAARVRDCVKAIEKRGALDMAKRQLQKCSQIMRYAVINDLASRNPVADVRPSDILPGRKKRNYARLDAKDLPQLLHDMDAYTGGEHTRLALQLMALTFVRTGELIGARWGEFDLAHARWNIPAERMKMKTPHIVPLSTQALAVLEKLQAISYGRDFVFPADTGKPTHMSNNTILYALYRMGYRGRMTGHGYRGIASTILHEQGWPHAHIELQLAHQEQDETSGAYNHANYLKPRTTMMQAWANYLDALRHDNVVPMHRGVA